MSVVSWSIAGVVVAAIAFFGMSGCSVMNKEANVRVAFEAKSEANKSDFDMLKKVLGKQAQGVSFHYDKLQEIMNGYADARTPDAKQAMMLWVKESIPNVDNTLMNKLLSTIEAQHAAFNQRQKELMDLWRADTLYFRHFPGGMFLSFIGRRPLDKPMLVTSAATKEAFRTGEDNDTDMGFSVKKPTNVEK